MGIKNLWTLLSPYCERKPLYELEGKIVAVDLAGWVCESLNVVDYVVQPRMYLRNLYFRTCYLVLSGVTPVFVLEGTAPALKYSVICKRNEMQFRGAKPKEMSNIGGIKKPDKGRTRFNHVLKQCEDLIKSIGLECVQGPGEAEAFCAYLNHDGMVDGIISQDSDCFAYGAVKVYRNFSVSTQGNVSAQGGSVDVYDINKVCSSIDFGQNKMIAMGLLCGCDYCPDGIDGVGKDSVLKLFNLYSNQEILERLKSWRTNNSKYTEIEIRVDDKNICVNCGHSGRVQAHVKNGCNICRFPTGCDSSLWKEQRLMLKAELQIRKKAMSNDEFPSQLVIDEFLVRPSHLPQLDLSWKQPNIVKFVKFMSNLLQWTEIYSFIKFLPLLTRWQLFQYFQKKNLNSLVELVTPNYIKKKRSPRGVPSYEIIWKDGENFFNGLIPDDQIKSFLSENEGGLDALWSTIEPAELVHIAYPEIVNTFLKHKNTKKKKKITIQSTTTRIRKKRNAIDGTEMKIKKVKHHMDGGNNSLNDMTKILDAINDVSKSNVKIKSKKTRKKSIKTIDKYFVHKENSDNKLDRTVLPNDISDVDDENDLSMIINSIITRSPKINKFKGKKLIYNQLTWNNTLVLDKTCDDLELLNTVEDRRNSLVINSKNNRGSFDDFLIGMNINNLNNDIDMNIHNSQNKSFENLLNNNRSEIALNEHHENLTQKQNSTPIFKFKQAKTATVNLRNSMLVKNLNAKKDICFFPNKEASADTKCNISYFFDDMSVEGDVFEQTMNTSDLFVNSDEINDDPNYDNDNNANMYE